MSDGPVTIVDIARELGLSKTTVADALSGAGRVAEPTRKRVAEAAERRGYVSNRAAKSLRSGKHGALGIYIPQAVRELSFYMQFVFGAADRANFDGNDITLIAAPRDGHRTHSLHIDGAIVVDPVPGDQICEELLTSQTPIVSVGVPVGGLRREHRRVAITRIPYETVIPAFLDEWTKGDTGPIAFVLPDDAFVTPWSRDIEIATTNWATARGVAIHEFKLPVVPSDAELRKVLDALRQAEVDFSRYLFAAERVAGRASSIIDRSSDGARLPIGTLSGDPGTELTNPRLAAMDLKARAFGARAVEFLEDMVTGTAAGEHERFHEVPAFVHT